MTCPTHARIYRLGETFTAPKVVISSATATEAQYQDAVVDWNMTHNILGTAVAADVVYKTVGFGSVSVADPYGNTTVTPEQWVLQLIAVIDFANTTFPEGEYTMRYSALFPGGVKQFYGELIICFKD